jgi:PadR family transcriptional regulator PadR
MKTNPFIKGSMQAIILNLLEQNGSMYGYEMTKAVREISKGKIVMNEAALYPALHKLEEQGILSTEHKKVEGRMRKYYKLTSQGKKESSQLIHSFQDTIETLQKLLNPKFI